MQRIGRVEYVQNGDDSSQIPNYKCQTNQDIYDLYIMQDSYLNYYYYYFLLLFFFM